MLFAHPGAVVAQRNIAAERRQRADIGFYAAAGRRILERIVQQVGEDGDQRMAVGTHHHLLAAVERQFDIFFQRIGDVLRDAFADLRIDIHRLNLQRKIFRLQLGQVDQLARQRRRPIQPLLHVADDFPALLLLVDLGQQMQLRQHGGDRRAQLVRGVGHKSFLALIGGVDARHQFVDLHHHRPDFLILFADVDRRQVARLTIGNGAGDLAQRPQAEIGGKQQGDDDGRQNAQQRYGGALRRVAEQRGAIVERFADDRPVLAILAPAAGEMPVGAGVIDRAGQHRRRQAQRLSLRLRTVKHPVVSIVNHKQRVIVDFILHAVIDGINVHAFNGLDDAAVIDIVSAGFVENIGDACSDDALLIIEIFLHVGVIPIFHPGDEEPPQ